jgi:hypothetical protein
LFCGDHVIEARGRRSDQLEKIARFKTQGIFHRDGIIQDHHHAVKENGS